MKASGASTSGTSQYRMPIKFSIRELYDPIKFQNENHAKVYYARYSVEYEAHSVLPLQHSSAFRSIRRDICYSELVGEAVHVKVQQTTRLVAAVGIL